MRGNGKNHTPVRNGHDPNFIPPHTELEQYLLAALLTDNRRLEDVGTLQPEHFGHEAHRRIFEVIRHLAADQLPRPRRQWPTWSPAMPTSPGRHGTSKRWPNPL